MCVLESPMGMSGFALRGSVLRSRSSLLSVGPPPGSLRYVAYAPWALRRPSSYRRFPTRFTTVSETMHVQMASPHPGRAGF
jgi:hypothetical protein